MKIKLAKIQLREAQSVISVTGHYGVFLSSPAHLLLPGLSCWAAMGERGGCSGLTGGEGTGDTGFTGVSFFDLRRGDSEI